MFSTFKQLGQGYPREKKNHGVDIYLYECGQHGNSLTSVKLLPSCSMYFLYFLKVKCCVIFAYVTGNCHDDFCVRYDHMHHSTV